MDWLSDFQSSFREPVFSWLGYAWPALAIIVLIIVWQLLYPSSGRGGDVSLQAGLLGDDGSDGDGGGDGGGGGD